MANHIKKKIRVIPPSFLIRDPAVQKIRVKKSPKLSFGAFNKTAATYSPRIVSKYHRP